MFKVALNFHDGSTFYKQGQELTEAKPEWLSRGLVNQIKTLEKGQTKDDATTPKSASKPRSK